MSSRPSPSLRSPGARAKQTPPPSNITTTTTTTTEHPLSLEPVPTSNLPAHTPDIMAEKPSVLIIGGLGYIGRFLALHIHRNNLASEVRLVDKVLPQLAWLAPEFENACSGSMFMQADASRERECFPPVHPCSASVFSALLRSQGQPSAAPQFCCQRDRCWAHRLGGLGWPKDFGLTDWLHRGALADI